MNNFFYVYILTSIIEPSRHYIGITNDLDKRLKEHNRGHVIHTSKYTPWEYETVIAFRSKEKAQMFEKYLKTHSGRSFSSKHF